MSDTPEYILKKPVDASYYEEGLMAVEFEELSECLIISDEQFQNTFQPLDIPAIEKQLDQIIKDSVDLGALLLHAQVKKELTLDECVERQKVQISDAVNQIKSLFGLEHKETE